MDKKESRYERRAKISKEIEKVLIEHDVTFFEFNRITEMLNIEYEHRAYLKKEGGINPPKKH
ncbi:hypothetical protein [Leptotrichia trevisanii]|uniref:hypothetical protein n=1 Tax=Leptotrichia trevisanii TaxID=109328 RepID=UPI0004167F63|nr:hypothetical protein [Leptotrichia trevisanii]